MTTQYPLYDQRNPSHKSFRQKVIKKIDLNTLPGVTLLYLACYIDRSNIGNAKVAGLVNDLGLTPSQFSIALSVLCVGAKIWLPLLVFCWGALTILAAFMTNLTTLIVVRLFLGLFEGGLLPGIVMFLSTLYKPEELQLRVGIAFAGASASGALGGLIAFGIQTKMDGVGGKPAWAWIFILEGLATILIAFFGWWYISSSLQSASYLSDDERDFAVNRLRVSKTSSMIDLSEGVKEKEKKVFEELSSEESSHLQTDLENDSQLEKFEWSEVFRAFLDPQVWLMGLAGTSIAIPLMSLGFYLPTLVGKLGHTGAHAQLYSAYPYMSACVLVVISAFLADKWHIRGPIVLALTPISIAGYVILIMAKDPHTLYGAFFLILAGAYPSVPCFLSIIPNNTSGITKRATSVAMQVMLSAVAGLIAPFIYPEGVPIVTGHKIALCLFCLAWILTAVNIIYCKVENSARMTGKRDYVVIKYLERFESGQTQAPLGDRDPKFRFTL
ncbi:major facilitator superfamily domain-containing protein [Melampsora americana]|nr:major facilitator superfamily domain-containing protein [Melampsora americana]